MVLLIEFHTKFTNCNIPSYYDVTQVLGSIRNQLVKEMGHFKFVQISYPSLSGGILHSSSDFHSKLTK